ncbi:hypothetical protein TNIN_451381 [Trichonephila inaurata madagascariensis]|uniref:Uncharacterized protein n=1 Tax=Trichonephila inaurata madagascariensis TaxID=2747483 RepID=A0A8X6YYU4_9ARAC|nr:hypothetical protein TNIN_451381 [Trichonephila inaurata madagascariensis]
MLLLRIRQKNAAAASEKREAIIHCCLGRLFGADLRQEFGENRERNLFLETSRKGDKCEAGVSWNLERRGLTKTKKSEKPANHKGIEGIGVKNSGIEGENREAHVKSVGTVTGIFCLLDLAKRGKRLPKMFCF